MKSFSFYTLVLILFFILPVNCNPGESDLLNSTDGLQVPTGFKVDLVAEQVGRARHITVNNNGDIYVALGRPQNGKVIAALRDQTGDGKADVIKYFCSLGSGTGIHIYNGFLYYAPDTSIYRFKLEKGELLPEMPPEPVVSGFPEQRQHDSKPFVIDKDGSLYVNIGGPSNACMRDMRTPGSPGMDPCPQLENYAGIWRFDANRTNQDRFKDGFRYATGIRNAVALDWNPLVNILYAVQHGRDQLDTLWPEFYNVEQNAELPAEEFFLIREGADFGWPYCYYDSILKKKVLAPEYGGDGQKTGRCDGVEKPILAFPAHWAPNDLLFYTGNQFPEYYHGGAFIAFHGSWNRAPLEQQGYKVVFVPFENDLPADEGKDFVTGFAGKDKIISTRDARYRPMGLAQGPDGSLYITDSRKGRIWKISYKGE